jgi:hypothetical protein
MLTAMRKTGAGIDGLVGLAESLRGDNARELVDSLKSK